MACARLRPTCARPWRASTTPRRWRRCALQLAPLRSPVAEASRSLVSRWSHRQPLPLLHIAQAFTVFDQRAQDTGALTGNVSSGCACLLPRPSALAPPTPPPRLTLGSRRAVPRQGVVEASHAWAVAERCLLACLPGREVRHIISNLGIDHLEEEELDEMLAEVDPHGTGVINYKDFVKKIFAPISVPAA